MKKTPFLSIVSSLLTGIGFTTAPAMQKVIAETEQQTLKTADAVVDMRAPHPYRTKKRRVTAGTKKVSHKKNSKARRAKVRMRSHRAR